MKVLKLIRCKLLNFHNWTSLSLLGVDPTKEQSNGGYEGFKEYAKMYCKDCGTESELNKRL